jgi:hypothetical protein
LDEPDRGPELGPARSGASVPKDPLTVLVAVDLGHEVVQAFSYAFGMTWEVLWARS